MPLYTYLCLDCGNKMTAFRKIAERDQIPCCEVHPGHPLHKDVRHHDYSIVNVSHRVIKTVEAPAVQTDLPGYQSPIDGRWIEGRRARTEDLKRSNCRPWEGMDTERKEAVKRAEAADTEFGQKIEAGVAEVYNGMSAESQRALAQL